MSNTAIDWSKINATLDALPEIDRELLRNEEKFHTRSVARAGHKTPTSGNRQPRTDEQKRQHSEKTTGAKRSDETRSNISKSLKGKPKSDEHRANLSAAQKEAAKRRGYRKPVNLGQKYTDEQKEAHKALMRSLPKIVCPHCGYAGNAGTIAHYHGDKCKHKPTTFVELFDTQ